MTLIEKSREVLELPGVLAELARQAVSPGAKEAAAALTPFTDRFQVRQSLRETSAAKKMMTLQGSPAFSSVRDVSAALSRAERGGTLSPAELLDIAAVLQAARGAASYAGGEEKNELDYLFSGLSPNKYLEEKITGSILSEEEIADAASPELADIRRHMRVAGDRVRQALQKIISSPSYAKALQEPIITMRSDRYVVPVKAEYKSSVPGLVHDISASGATLFIEPMSSVEANNEIRELLSKEKKEIDRILAALSAEAASYAEEINRNVSVLTELDLIFAKAKLSWKMDGCEPEITDSCEIDIKKGRHPLLPRAAAVPIDVRLGGAYDTLVITGPNTGGKTVSLKTIGLFCLMAGCGLHLPAADGSRIPVFRAVLADIGDEQSIQQSLSTFSAHMTNIVRILEQCGEGTLLLFDELGAGTDPVEGAALAIAIIEYARQMGSVIAATTHYAELKMYATTSDGVQNASCEFDVETLQPTYRLLTGIPGKSNAFAISGRLGLAEHIIEDARSRIDSQSASFEEVLENLEKTRQEMEQEKRETRRLLRRAEEEEKQAEQYRAELQKEREKAAQIARREAEELLDNARRTADQVLDEARQLQKQMKQGGDWHQVNDARSRLRRRLNEAEDRIYAAQPAAGAAKNQRALRPGDTVVIAGSGTQAVVESVSEDGTAALRCGAMKITARAKDLTLLDTGAAKEKKTVRQTADVKLRSMAVKPEIDLRGMMTDEAIPVLERYLDSALLAGLHTVTVIHGKGTGALRAAVQQCLKKDRRLRGFRLGRYGEGEDGVTVVTLKE